MNPDPAPGDPVITPGPKPLPPDPGVPKPHWGSTPHPKFPGWGEAVGGVEAADMVPKLALAALGS